MDCRAALEMTAKSRKINRYGYIHPYGTYKTRSILEYCRSVLGKSPIIVTEFGVNSVEFFPEKYKTIYKENPYPFK